MLIAHELLLMAGPSHGVKKRSLKMNFKLEVAEYCEFNMSTNSLTEVASHFAIESETAETFYKNRDKIKKHPNKRKRISKASLIHFEDELVELINLKGIFEWH